MSALPSYSTGTVAVVADGTAVVGTSTLWLTAGNAKPGDFFQVGHFGVFITDLADDTHLTIPPWPGATASGVAYNIWKVSLQRVVGSEAWKDVDKIVAALNANGYIVFVPPTLMAPDPSLGEENQTAFQPTTGKMWVMTGGVWNYLGLYRGFNARGAYDNVATFSVGDFVSSAGSSYVWINPTPGSGHAPPNATYWQLLASKGDTGGIGPTGAGYGGTSTTSRTIGVGSHPFATQAGLAYTNGARVRATSNADSSKWLEGPATYAGTTLTISADLTSGSTATVNDWNFNLAGQPGTVAGAAVLYNAVQTLTDAQKAQARDNIGVTKKNYIINGGMQVSQENGATAGTTNGYYPVDQFELQRTTSGAISVAQVASVTPGGSTNRLRATVTSADASVDSGDIVYLLQRLEGLRAADLKFGLSAAKTITVQFGIKVPAGTYGVAVWNGLGNRCYVAEYTVSGGEANTDVVKSVTIPGDTTGTWATDNSGAMLVFWSLMAGSNYQQTAGSWQSAAKIATSNQFNFMGTVGNVFELFDVSLVEGSAAPAFQLPDYATELARCQRYFYKIGSGVFWATGMLRSGGTQGYLYSKTPQPMRAQPTLSAPGNQLWCADNSSGLSSLGIGGIDVSSGQIYLAPVATSSVGSAGQACMLYTATGSVSFNARL
ncbi:hypothetical protein [Bradyrhizobium sp. LA2.1]|uniref:hypothetical protein n=1 Tax=Bradyrhizobium sp. LA2.1 TaxID=3156376 RepID=UPI00339A79D0